jgi:dihydropteroate synthase
VLPVVGALASRLPLVISVDTSKPGLMHAAVEAGAGMINDVRALCEPGALEAVASTHAAVCLMHMQGEPRTMQADPRYQNVVTDVRDFLNMRAQACVAAGIAREQLVLDPGIGFGKRLEHNLALLVQLGFPVLIGASRKAMFGALLSKPVTERLYGGLAVATAAVLGGASIVRAHDVAETVDALKIAAALRDAGYTTGA